MDDFLAKAREMGYDVKAESEKLAESEKFGELRSFQSEILKSKAVKIAEQQKLGADEQKKNFVPTPDSYKPVVFGQTGRIINGHHSWQGLKRSYGDDKQVDIRRLVRKDGRELSRQDNLALYKAAISTKVGHFFCLGECLNTFENKRVCQPSRWQRTQALLPCLKKDRSSPRERTEVEAARPEKRASKT
jgi:hypothetical protein